MTVQTDIGTAYNAIQDAINAALKKTADGTQVTQLLAEYNVARNAYSAAQNAMLNESDPLLQHLDTQLSQASQALAAATTDIQDMQKYLGCISDAVGTLSKIAALVG